MGEIPDMDDVAAPSAGSGAAAVGKSDMPDLAKLSVDAGDGAQDEDAVPDMDDIPDIDDEGMEEEEDVATAQPVRKAAGQANE